MKIEIDLNDLGFTYDLDGDPIGRQTLTDAIVEAAAHLIVREIKDTLVKDIRQQVTAQVAEQVTTVVAEEMAKPIQRTTLWGEKQGEPTSVREMIRERIEKYMAAPASRRDRYNSGRSTVDNMVELVEQEVRAVMNTELKDAIAAAKREVVNTIRDKALAAAVDAIKPRA